MVILDNLIEKKDLLLYLTFRKEGLNKQLKKIEKYPEKKRERIVKLLESRIKELSKLNLLIRSNKLKENCKEMWPYLDKKNGKEKESKRKETNKRH